MAANEIQVDRIHDLLIYESGTGLLRWRKDHGRKTKAGVVAGHLSHGYIRIGLDGRDYPAHRLAWLYVYGELPTVDVDHIDGDRSNNRIVNLRLASRSENLQNQTRPRSDNSTGFLGVSWDAKKGLFKASLKVNGRTVFTKRTATAEDAHAAYLEAKKLFHPFTSAR